MKQAESYELITADGKAVFWKSTIKFMRALSKIGPIRPIKKLSLYPEKEDDVTRKNKKTVYSMTWRNKFLTLGAKTIRNMQTSLRAAADELERMEKAGVKLDPHGGTSDDYATLITTDPGVAIRFDMRDENEDEE